MILPELISKEPLGPAVRRGDDEFVRDRQVGGLRPDRGRGVRHHAGQRRQDEGREPDPVVMRILGKTEDTGKLLGLDKDWMVRALKAVGNYGEIFERNVGPKTAAQPAARREQPVEQGRPAVRAAGPLTALDASPAIATPSRGRCTARDASRRAAGAPRRAQPPPRKRDWSWRSQAFRGLVYQVVALAAGRLRRLVPRAQHARQHAGARHPERLRLPRRSPPASTSASR